MYRRRKHTYTPYLTGIAVFGGLLWLMHQLGSMLTPFVSAAILAYILNPLVEKLRDRGLKRGMAAMVVMLFALGLLTLLLLIIVPMLVNQFQNMLVKLPTLVAYVQDGLLPWINAKFRVNIALDMGSIDAWLKANTADIQDSLSKAVPMLMKQGGNVLLMAANMVLLPFLLYYFLLDWQRWNHGLKAMIPRRYVDTVNRITANMDRVLGEFLRGQLTVMLVMGTLYGVGLMLVGLDSGFAIGMVAGLLVFVPYLGAFVGLLLATLAALLQFNSLTGLLMVWAVFGIGQFIESFLITPKIVGDRIGLSPFWVIFALAAFGQLMGFVGMLLALPLAAICLVLFREGVDAYFKTGYYLREK